MWTWPHFFKLKLELDNQKEGVIFADSSGHVVIRIIMPDELRVSGAALKLELTTRDKQQEAGGCQLDTCFYHITEGLSEVRF